MTNSKEKFDEKGNVINEPIISVKNAFLAFVTINIISAVFNNISDCDETYNYWEPLHHLLYGSDESFQTWEYAKEYGLRSWGYISLHAAVVFIHAKLFHLAKPVIFQFIRVGLAVMCAAGQTSAYVAINQKFGPNLARNFFYLSLLSAGTFISSTAFLPSSCCMYFGYALLATWLDTKKANAAVYSVGFGAILGWPFFAAMGVPVAFQILVIRRKILKFIKWSLETLVISGAFTFIWDYFMYKKIMFSPANIVLYNVFSNKGPDLYGVEPVSYYIKNLILNWNICFIFAVLSLPLAVGTEYYFSKRSKHYQPAIVQFLIYLSPLYIWLSIFFLQPHKEERFLFPVYPFIAFSGAVFLSSIQKLWKLLLDEIKFIPTHFTVNNCLLTIFGLVSISRILAVVFAYQASLNIYSNVLIHLEFDTAKESYNLCLGKEWHRFGSHFLIPDKFRVHFIESEFKAQLPGKFQSTWPYKERLKIFLRIVFVNWAT